MFQNNLINGAAAKRAPAVDSSTDSDSDDPVRICNFFERRIRVFTFVPLLVNFLL